MSKNLPYKVLLNQLVSVSYTDNFLGSIDKWKAHTHQYLRQANSMPHRAFSIFLFNSRNELLFQRRSLDKKTFPLCWTNTCCSHPNMIENQKGEKQVQDIRAALHRALDRQLKMDLTNQNFFLVDKIVYKAFGAQNTLFGQYEVDYVFLCKLNTIDAKYQLVQEQICEVQWVKKEQIHNFMNNKIKQGCYFSPWFQKMMKNGLLQKWWNQVQQGKVINLQADKIQVKNYL